MRIFLAGGSGVIGIRLIPALLAAGHEVVATTRRAENVARISQSGAQGVVVDAYDAQGLEAAVAAADPDLVLHELTDLSEHDTEANARLRREGTANLVRAAKLAGVDRMIAQSIAWIFPDGEMPATEDDPITLGSAVDDMEQLVRSMTHATILRYGMLYGPSTWYAPEGEVAKAVRAGMVPATPAITNFVHIDDVVDATVKALSWSDGTYHIVDDEPAAGTVWLPVFAARLNAPAPPVAPLPEGAPRGRAVSNTKARAAGWVPNYRSWRDGFTV
ncbi:NAD-dependent epimerase/dehydratase family protein [Leifsonia sp. 2MCAF36]|uniref:NAD-dependent epimerase/dehydratase family protein n=1 Tax=Leifsonia sp. 2MCAF36 TaxID=3232988 RepID=UPI003F97BDF9